MAPSITIVSGPTRITIPLDCDSVEDLRAQVGDQVDIPEDASASVDGRTVGDDYEPQDGDEVVFSKTTGAKG